MSKVILVPLNALPSDFDPQTMSDIYSMIANLQLHRGLLKFNSILEVESDIAESYEILDNGREIVFRIRSNAKFSDGSRITADDVVKTFKRMFKIKSDMASDLSYIENSDDIQNIGVIRLDDHRVKFRLKHPSSLFLKQLSTVDCSILSLNDDLSLNMKFSGPYKLKKKDNRSVTLDIVRGSEFPSAPTEIKFELKSETLENSIEQIKVFDSIDGLNISEDIKQILKRDGWRESVSTTANLFALVVNNKKVNSRIRDHIFNFFYFEKSYVDLEHFIPLFSVVPPAISTHANRLNFKRIEMKKEKNQLKLTMLVVKGSAPIPMLQKAVIDFEKLTNIQINLIEHPVDIFLNKVKAEDFELRLLPKSIDYPDPYAMLSYFRSGYSANKYFVSDKKIDQLLDQSISQLDKNKRNEINLEIQNKILSKKVFIPLFSGSKQAKLWGPRIRLVPAHPMGLISLPFEKIEMK